MAENNVFVLGAGIVNQAPAPSAEGEPGVTPPPPQDSFVIDLANDFLIDHSGNRLINGG